MKSGIKYVDGMDLHGVIKAGLEDFELDYTGCKSADMILENGGNIDGIAISLCDFTDKGFLKENASQIFRDAMSVADRYNAYIVIDTANVKKASVLEQIIDECVNEIAASDVNVFIENGIRMIMADSIIMIILKVQGLLNLQINLICLQAVINLESVSMLDMLIFLV